MADILLWGIHGEPGVERVKVRDYNHIYIKSVYKCDKTQTSVCSCELCLRSQATLISHLGYEKEFSIALVRFMVTE